MRNTASGGKTSSTMLFSSRADSRSWPKGFSMTTLRHSPSSGWARPCSESFWQTVSKALGGMER